MSLLKIVSTPQVARAKRMENTATTTMRLDDSALDGRVTLFLSSVIESLIYDTIFLLLINYRGIFSLRLNELSA